MRKAEKPKSRKAETRGALETEPALRLFVFPAFRRFVFPAFRRFVFPAFRRFGVSAFLLLGSVRADEITTRTEHFRKIKIVDYAFGRIRFRLPAGDLADVSVLDVRALLVDSAGGVGDLNEAEIYMDKGQPSPAVLRYERALRSTEGFWQELTRVRLLQACDQATHLDKAVTHWLAMLKSDPALAAELLPRSIPPARSPAVSRALSDLEAAGPKLTDEPGRRLVDLVRFSIYCRLGEEEADGLAARGIAHPLTGPMATVPAYGVMTEALRRVFQKNQPALVLTALEAALAECPSASLPDLLLLKGEVLYATARERADFVRAGWAFMRVPIHYPDDPRAPRALLWAARVHERMEAPEKAVKLLQECQAHPACDPETRAAAAEALSRLSSRKAERDGDRPLGADLQSLRATSSATSRVVWFRPTS